MTRLSFVPVLALTLIGVAGAAMAQNTLYPSDARTSGGPAPMSATPMPAKTIKSSTPARTWTI